MIIRDFPFNEYAAKKLLGSRDTFAFVLMTILLSKYDTDIFDEEIEVIAAQIKDDFDVDIPEEVENRINAAITVLTTDLPMVSYHVFKAVAMAFAEGNIGTEEDREDEELNVCEILWALQEMALLRGQTMEEVKQELRPYVVDDLNNIIDDEAEDIDEVEETDEEGLEAITAAGKDPYYWKYTVESMKELIEQLRRLGAPEGVLVQIRQAFID